MTNDDLRNRAEKAEAQLEYLQAGIRSIIGDCECAICGKLRKLLVSLPKPGEPEDTAVLGLVRRIDELKRIESDARIRQAHAAARDARRKLSDLEEMLASVRSALTVAMRVSEAR